MGSVFAPNSTRPCTQGRGAQVGKRHHVKAMVLRQPGAAESRPLVLRDVQVPTTGPGEILIHVRACGVCHTDVHIVEGDLPPQKTPLIPGHQVIGVVEQIGEGVTRVARGARVGVPWLYASCGHCEHCRNDRENLCEEITFTGYHVDGGYAEFMVANADFAYAVPDRFDDLVAAPLLCAGLIGYRSLKLAEVRPGSRVGLFGFGASAHLAIQVARYWGCEVYVFSRSAAHRRLASDLGAAWVGESGDRPPRPLDSAVVFAPSGRVVVDALRHLARGATLAINAIHLDGIPEFDYQLLYWERTVRSVSNSTRRDAEEFLPLAAAIPVEIVTAAFPLEGANEALAALKRGEITGAAVLDIAGSR